MCNIKVMREQYACSAGKSSPQRKRHNFVFVVSIPIVSAAISFSRIARQQRPGAEFLKFFNKENDEDHNPENPGEIGQTGYAHQSGSTAHIIDIQDTDTK